VRRQFKSHSAGGGKKPDGKDLGMEEKKAKFSEILHEKERKLGNRPDQRADILKRSNLRLRRKKLAWSKAGSSPSTAVLKTNPQKFLRDGRLRGKGKTREEAPVVSNPRTEK